MLRALDRPVVALAVAIAAALGFAALIVLVSTGEERRHLLVYDVPIGVPFVLFGIERLRLPSPRRRAAWALDAAVVGVSLARAVWRIPWISGHALFLAYALVSGRGTLLRVAAALVLAEVLYLKLFVWRDATGIGGVVVGVLAGVWARRLDRPSNVAT